MTASTRHDVHAAAHADFDPADYKLIGVIDLHPEPAFRADDSRGRKAVRAMESEGFPYAKVHPYGQCDACGQCLRYVAVLFHHPSAALVQVGLDCLSGRFAMAKDEVKRMMAEAKAARDAHKLLDGFLAACEADQTLAYATYAQNILVADTENDLWDRGLFTLADIARKCRQYGNGASEGQHRFMDKIFATLDRNAAEAAARRAARAEKAAQPTEPRPVVEGRQEVTGEIVKTDVKTNVYNGVERTRFVMTVRTDDGALVWGTQPSAIMALDAGDRVAFTATFEPNADRTLSFYSRLVQARIA